MFKVKRNESDIKKDEQKLDFKWVLSIYLGTRFILGFCFSFISYRHLGRWGGLKGDWGEMSRIVLRAQYPIQEFHWGEIGEWTSKALQWSCLTQPGSFVEKVAPFLRFPFPADCLPLPPSLKQRKLSIPNNHNGEKDKREIIFFSIWILFQFSNWYLSVLYIQIDIEFGFCHIFTPFS